MCRYFAGMESRTLLPLVLILGLLIVASGCAGRDAVSGSVQNRWTAVSAGGAADSGYSIVLRADGTLWACGADGLCQLGLGRPNRNARFRLTPVGRSDQWSAVSCGYAQTLALGANGTLWTWGARGGPLLPIVTPQPVRVGHESGWAAISASGGNLVLGGDGSLWHLGGSAAHPLNGYSRQEKQKLVRVGRATDWAAIAAGEGSNLALKRDGTLWAWGVNYSGELGVGDVRTRNNPVQVGGQRDWSAISCYGEHSLALRRDGTLWAWGSNREGQLGLGDRRDRLVPTKVGSASDWESIAAGYDYSLAIKSDGSLWSWGRNESGQLGLGDRLPRTRPTAVGHSHDWSVASAAILHALALKKDGTLWGWGDNTTGALGVRGVVRSLTPRPIPGGATE